MQAEAEKRRLEAETSVNDPTLHSYTTASAQQVSDHIKEELKRQVRLPLFFVLIHVPVLVLAYVFILYSTHASAALYALWKTGQG